MKKLLLTLLLLSTIVSVSLAQDPNFSQFFASPLTLNPALTGKFDGNFRVAGNYRNQWPSINNAFVTKTGSADFHLLRNNLPEIDRWGFGVLFMNDQNGNGALRTNQFSLSTAYHKGLNKKELTKTVITKLVSVSRDHTQIKVLMLVCLILKMS